MQRFTSISSLRPIGRRERQQGVTLLFALIALVVLMIGTLALVRSVDLNALLMGNLSFKQDATATAEQATQQAIDWLSANATALNDSNPASGYYASTQEYAADGSAASPVDVTGRQFEANVSRQLVEWQSGCSDAPTSGGASTTCSIKPIDANGVNGNAAKYVIFRLCSKDGDLALDTTIQCTRPVVDANADATTKGALNYQNPIRMTNPPAPYFRIVARVQGARNTVSFTETIVHF